MTGESKSAAIRHAIPGRIRFKVPALSAGGEVARGLEKRLGRLEGVRWVRVNSSSGSLVVGYDGDAIGADDLSGEVRAVLTARKAVVKEDEKSRDRSPGKFGKDTIFSALLRFLGMSLMVGVILFRRVVLKKPPTQNPLSPIGILAVVAAVPLVKKGIGGLYKGQITLEGFLGISILAALAAGEVVTAVEVLWINSAGRLLQAWITERSRRAVRDILHVTEKNAYVLVEGAEASVPVHRVQPGDTVVIHAGEKISVDGVIVRGGASIDESPLNGRSEPVAKQMGQEVFAGTFVLQGLVFVNARQVGDKTYLARILRMVEESLVNKAPIEGVADQLAKNLVKAGFAATLGTLSITGSFWRAFTVMLVMACPCATVLAATTAVSAGLATAARRGVLIKGGRYLEEVGRADVVCFDKTGTLTTNQPVIGQMATLDDLTEDGLLQIVYSTEIHNSHPVALAVKAAAERKGIEPVGHDVCEYLLGRGVRAEIRGEEILVGNRRLMEQFGVRLESARSFLRRFKKQGLTPVHVARTRKLVGVMGIANRDRPNSDAVIRALRNDGVKKIAMVTGDSKHVAMGMAARLGLDDCRYSVLPEEKAEIMADLSRNGDKVVMVGDGINDAMALAVADIGIAMGTGGSEVAIEAADIALVEDDLAGIVYLRSLSKETIRVVHQNFWIATATNLAGAVLGAVGLLSPVAAGLVHISHTLCILANSSRLLGFGSPGLAYAGEVVPPGTPLYRKEGGVCQMDWEIVEDLQKHLRVAHHVPGRIRLSFDASLMGHPRVDKILQEGKTPSGVRSIRINAPARSIIIEYNREVIRPELMQELFSTNRKDRIVEIVDMLSTL